MNTFRFAGIALLATCGAFGQVFEVASVKPNHSGDGRVMISRGEGGRFTTENASLKMLITFAYDVRETQLSGGPAWLDSDRWDIVAKPEGAVPQSDAGTATMRAMVRALLADRFHLMIHKESKEMPVYAMVVGKSGPKLKESTPEAKGPSMRMGMGTLEGTKVKISMLARALSGQLGRTVTDATGLTGDYDIKLQFAPEPGGMMMKGPAGEHPEAPPADSDRPTLTAAIQEQLGLKLEARKEQVETIVVDSAEKANEN